MLKKLLSTSVFGFVSAFNAVGTPVSAAATADLPPTPPRNTDLIDAAAGPGQFFGQVLTRKLREAGINPQDRTVKNALFEKSIPGVCAAFSKALFRHFAGDRFDTRNSKLRAVSFFVKLLGKAPKSFCGYNKALKPGQDFKSFTESWACTNENLTDLESVVAAYVAINVAQDGRLAEYLDQDLSNATKAIASLVDDEDLIASGPHERHVYVHAMAVKHFVLKFVIPFMFNKLVVNRIAAFQGLDKKKREEAIEAFKKDNILYNLVSEITSSLLISPLVTASLNPRISKWTKLFTGEADSSELVSGRSFRITRRNKLPKVSAANA